VHIFLKFKRQNSIYRFLINSLKVMKRRWKNKEKDPMQPCDALKRIVLQHYGKFDAGEQGDSIKDIYSLEEGVIIIGNDPEEWFEDHDSILAFIKAGGSSKLDIQVHNIKAICEGSVGWTMDRVTVILPNGKKIPVRHTRIFHKENGSWKLVHLHVSIAVPNDRIGKWSYTNSLTSGNDQAKGVTRIQLSAELKYLILQLYGNEESGGLLDVARRLYSRQDDVIVIGSEPNNRYEGYESIIHFYEAASAAVMKIEIDNLQAYREGIVGWVVYLVKAKLPNGIEIPVRHILTSLIKKMMDGKLCTRIFP